MKGFQIYRTIIVCSCNLSVSDWKLDEGEEETAFAFNRAIEIYAAGAGGKKVFMTLMINMMNQRTTNSKSHQILEQIAEKLYG